MEISLTGTARETDQECSRCGESIKTNELAQEMLVGKITDEGFLPSIENDDLEYDPMYYHHECWLATMEEVMKMEPAKIPDASPDNIPCAICGSNVGKNDKLGRYRSGTIECSKYFPNGNQAYEFKPDNNLNNIRLLCLPCIQAAELVDAYDAPSAAPSNK